MENYIDILKFVFSITVFFGIWYFLRNILSNSYKSRQISIDLIQEITELKKEISELKQQLINNNNTTEF
jgi:hypothetical protein